ncbi:MAG: hypothetical protein GY705_06645 [Bacteroidetes bacterium]|nr:hypothetical protein [Bacteroidota bacterium]
MKFWTIPEKYEGVTVIFPNTENPYAHAQMSYDKKDSSVNISMEWLKKFSYKIEFGEEKDFKIPIAIEGLVSSPKKIKVHGKFFAATAGIRMTDGVIDRSFDHLDSIKWMSRDWIGRNTNSKYIFENPDICFMENKSKIKSTKRSRKQVAACSFLYMDDSSFMQIAKLWFEKVGGEWQVVKNIDPDSLFASSPIKPPFRNQPPYIYKKIAADEFENRVYKSGGGYKKISEPTLWPCGGGQVGDQPGWCELSYKVYKNDRVNGNSQEFECKYTTYIFEKDKNNIWFISKILDSNMKYDHQKQKVIPRTKKSGWSCG